MAASVLREAHSSLAAHLFTALMFVVLTVAVSGFLRSIRDRPDVQHKDVWTTVLNVVSGSGVVIMVFVFLILVFRDKPAAQRALEHGARMRAMAARNAPSGSGSSPVDRFVTARR